MAKAYCCDGCGKLIKENEVRIHLSGYEINRTARTNRMPSEFALRDPEEFCSFTCLAMWAEEEQGVFDDFLEVLKKHRESHEQASDDGEE